MMGPSALAYAAFMTWLGRREHRRVPPKAAIRTMALLLCAGATIGLFSPLGTLVWTTEYTTFSDFMEFAGIAGPAGAITGLVCGLPLWGLWRVRRIKVD